MTSGTMNRQAKIFSRLHFSIAKADFFLIFFIPLDVNNVGYQ